MKYLTALMISLLLAGCGTVSVQQPSIEKPQPTVAIVVPPELVLLEDNSPNARRLWIAKYSVLYGQCRDKVIELGNYITESITPLNK